MWTAYPAIARQRSQGAGPSTSPTSTYPPELYEHHPLNTSTSDPRTPPPLHRKSLSRVEETELEESLVARDYAQVGKGKGKGNGVYRSPYEMSQTDTEEDGYTYIRPRALESRAGERVETKSPGMDKEMDMGMIPPESIHDAYLSKYIEPIQGPSNNRPPVARSTSTPAPAGLLTSPISLKVSASPIRGLYPGLGDGTPSGSVNAHGHGHGERKQIGVGQNKGREGKDGRPIFEIFNADFEEGSEGMVRALKGHLEDVLKVQEEIGRMHLDLEGLGEGRRASGSKPSEDGAKGADGGSPVIEGKGKKDEGDELLKREKGVDELMERLATLSNNLRTYHDLGTPTLSFSHSQPNTAIYPTSEPTPVPPSLNRLHSADPDFLTTSPDMLSPSPPRAEVPRSLPTRTPVAVHKGIDDLRRQEGLPSRRSTVRHGQDLDISSIGESSSNQNQRQASASSDLSPLHLSMDDYEIKSPASRPHPGEEGIRKPIQKKTSASFSDLAALQRDREREREREKGQDSWMEFGLELAPDEVVTSRRNGSLRSGTGTGTSRRAGMSTEGRTVDSPLEMVDRTRPW